MDPDGIITVLHGDRRHFSLPNDAWTRTTINQEEKKDSLGETRKKKLERRRKDPQTQESIHRNDDLVSIPKTHHTNFL